jgi:hypothetical protein
MSSLEKSKTHNEEPYILKLFKNTFNLESCVNLFIGSQYYFLHQIFTVCIAFILCFSNNINHLSVILLIVFIDALSVSLAHDCPLTIMERQYLGTSSVDHKHTIMKNMGINYKCDHIYEQVIELLIAVFLMICMKIFFLIIFNTFNIKLS